MTEEDVAAAIDKRAEARQAKDYSKADAVRAELSKKGIAIMDTAEGVEWRPTTPEL
jgi:cysteinyl-tRNA synthetase